MAVTPVLLTSVPIPETMPPSVVVPVALSVRSRELPVTLPSVMFVALSTRVPDPPRGHTAGVAGPAPEGMFRGAEPALPRPARGHGPVAWGPGGRPVGVDGV